ncbi:MAG: hypothetical protein ABFS42_13320 [Candidatus Krumholzibacteriota bacterium]
MKSIILPLFLLIILAAMLLGGCARPIQPQPIMPSRYVDVYYTDECLPSTLAKDSFIENLWVYPGDSVAFINTSDQEIKIKFPSGMFEKDEAIIKSGKRVILKVIEVSPKNGPFIRVDIVCPVGTPKVQVGEEP